MSDEELLRQVADRLQARIREDQTLDKLLAAHRVAVGLQRLLGTRILERLQEDDPEHGVAMGQLALLASDAQDIPSTAGDLLSGIVTALLPTTDSIYWQELAGAGVAEEGSGSV